MITLSEFKSSLAQVVRPNRFLVTFNPPSIFEHGVDLVDLKFFVQGAVIPAKTVGSVPIKFHGMELNLPGDSSHEDLTLNMLNHYDWIGRDFFEEWVEVIQNIAEANAKSDAFDLLNDASIVVTQIGDTEDDVLAEYQFNDVFPKNVGEMELAMENGDSVEMFQVTFAYSYWEQI